MKETLREFLEDYEGFDYEKGEIVIVDQRSAKSYICKWNGKTLQGHYHDFSRELNRSMWEWTHTANTMLITL